MQVGDLVKLPQGTVLHWDLKNPFAILVEKLPRADVWEYDWKVFVDGRYIELGSQIEILSEAVSEVK